MYPRLTGNKLLVVQTDADGLRVMLLFLRRFGEQMCTSISERLIFGGLEVEVQAVVAVRLQRRTNVLRF